MDQATLRWINFAFEVLQALGVLFSLWLASGIAIEQFINNGSDTSAEEYDGGEPDFDDFDEPQDSGMGGWQPRFGRGMAIVMWLMLSGLFYLPLSDIITGLRTAVFLGIGWSEMGLSPAFNSFGSIPQNYYFLLTLILLVIVYGLVLWIGRRFFAGGALLADLPISSIERTFVLLGAAGLVHFLVFNFLSALTWIDLPNQTAQPQGGSLAFLAPALVGVLLILLLVVWMNASLLREEIQMEDDELDAYEEDLEPEVYETIASSDFESSSDMEIEADKAEASPAVEVDEDEETEDKA